MEIIKKIKITEQEIEDIMVTALEGGINYWCDKVEIKNNPTNKDHASEVIAYGGELILHVEGKQWILNREMVLRGIEKAMDHFKYDSFKKFMDEHDATTADVIIQFAIFYEIIFG